MTTMRDLIEMLTSPHLTEDQVLDLPIFVKLNSDDDDDTVLGIMPGYDLTVTVRVLEHDVESVLLEWDGNTIGEAIRG
jgi:hypothetical protein